MAAKYPCTVPALTEPILEAAKAQRRSSLAGRRREAGTCSESQKRRKASSEAWYLEMVEPAQAWESASSTLAAEDEDKGKACARCREEKAWMKAMAGAASESHMRGVEQEPENGTACGVWHKGTYVPTGLWNETATKLARYGRQEETRVGICTCARSANKTG